MKYKYQVYISPRVQVEFDAEIVYSAKSWSKAHARRYAQEIQKIVQELRYNPYIYTLKPHLGANIRSVDYKGTRIVYRVQEEQKLVEILGFPSIHSFKTFEG